MFINFGFFSRPYSLIKGPTFIKFWNFYQGLQKFSSLMVFLLHKFAHFVHALRLFKALRLFFLTNFPGPTVIPCPTSIPDSRVSVFYMSAKIPLLSKIHTYIKKCSLTQVYTLTYLNDIKLYFYFLDSESEGIYLRGGIYLVSQDRVHACK